MTVGGYLGGLAVSLSIFGGAAFAAIHLRRMFLSGWTGSPARLAEAVIWIALLLGVAEAFGTLGVLRRFPVLFGCVACAVSVKIWARRRRSTTMRERPAHSAPRLGRFYVIASATICAALLSEWVARTLYAMANGMSNLDTLWYHLPFAARYVQTGDITSLPPNPFDARVPFYPANSELLHATVMLPFHHDFTAGLVNLGALGLALLAGWCLGRPYGAAPATLTAVALLLAAPIFLVTQPGNATNDVLALGFFLSAVALLVNGGRDPAAVACAGLAAGLAVGTKLTVGVPTAALTISVIGLAERQRKTIAFAWLAPLMASGAYWFVRNFVAVGSPLPSVKLGIGSIALPHFTFGAPFAAPFADYLTDAHVWRTAYLPPLSVNFSRGWYGMFGLAATGVVLALVAGTRFQRSLAAVALATAVGFAFTPTTGYGGFLFSVRYLAPALALGLVLVPIVAAGRDGRQIRWVFLALGVVAMLVEVLAIQRWYLGAVGWELAGAAVAVAGLAGLGLTAPRNLRPGWIGLLVIVSISVAGVSGWFIQRHDDRHRYAAIRPRGETFSEDSPQTLRLFAWANTHRHERIAIAGLAETYPLFGPDLSNRVDYLVEIDSFDRQRPLASCITWRRRLQRGRYGFVVVAPTGYPFVDADVRPEAQWTRTSKSAEEILRAGPIELFRLHRPVTAAGCPHTPTA